MIDIVHLARDLQGIWQGIKKIQEESRRFRDTGLHSKISTYKQSQRIDWKQDKKAKDHEEGWGIKG